MKKSLIPLAIFGLALLALVVFLFWKKGAIEIADNKSAILTENEENESEDGYHSAYFMNEDFYGDLEQFDESYQSDDKIYGGIVSHHFLMAREIAKLISSLKPQEPETLVIIGPNHFNVGKGDILVSKYPYNTPWGNVRPDKKVIEELLSAKMANNDENPFSKEHSISTLVGFIKYYLPDTRIVPLILKRNVTQERSDELAEKLIKTIPEDSMVIASVDFSHHLNKTATEFHDERSVSIVDGFDFERLYSAEIDSPASLNVLLKYLESKGAYEMDYANINSANFLQDPNLEDGTSYLFSRFTNGEKKKESTVSLLSFGDMMLGRDVGSFIDNGGNPLSQIIGQEGNFFRGIDFISANLEGPITRSQNCSEKIYSFKFKPSVAKMISESGIGIVNLSNNHIFDCGQEGIDDTKENLENYKIGYFGEFNPDNSYTIKRVGGKNLVFIGIDITTQSNNLNEYYDLVSQLKKQNDYVVVNVHWGIEYSESPSQKQKETAHSLIDSGADIIIGHHPHIIQPIEVYKNKAIFYSLGNFIFDQVGKDVNEGLGVGVVFSGSTQKHFLFPLSIEKYQPKLFPHDEAISFCDKYLSEIKGAVGCQFEL